MLGYFKPFTTVSAQVGASDLTDFPLLIRVTDPDFATVANGGVAESSDGYDIRPFTDDALTTPLDYFLVPGTYDPATGSFEMWVRIPTLDKDANQTFYLGVGDSSISTDGSTTDVWDADFVGVWPLSGAFADLTANGNDGTNNGTAAIAAIIGEGRDFSSGDYIDFGNDASLDIQGEIRISAWVKTGTFSGFQSILSNYNAAGTHEQYDIVIDPTGRLIFSVSNAGFKSWYTASLTTDTWYFVEVISDGTLSDGGVKIFVNGADATNAVVGTITMTTTRGNTVTGRSGDFNGNFMVGQIDHIVLSKVARSEEWGVASYNNQKPSSTFLTWGLLYPYGTVFADFQADPDGNFSITAGPDASWDTVHDAATGTVQAFNVLSIASLFDGLDYRISRSFLPVDTSGLPAGATIVAASLFVNVTGVNIGDADAQAYVALVGPTTQADPEALVDSDYTECAPVDGPTEWSPQMAMADIDVGWFEIPLITPWNKINVNGFTLIGAREGHDVEDVAVAGNNFVQTYNATETGKEPYLRVAYTVPAGVQVDSVTPSVLSDGITGVVIAGSSLQQEE